MGAATFCNGRTGLAGVVSEANSLTGSTAGDGVGWTIIPLVNGNYLVSSPCVGQRCRERMWVR